MPRRRRPLRLPSSWLGLALVGPALLGLATSCFVPEFSHDGVASGPGSGGGTGTGGSGIGGTSGGTSGTSGSGGSGGHGSGTGGGGSGGVPSSGGVPGSGGVPSTGGGGSGGTPSSGGAPSSGGDSGSGGGPFVPGRTDVYLLIGDQNMWGVRDVAPEAQDQVTNDRVEVFTVTDYCSTQYASDWMTAEPPLHGCIGNYQADGPSVGPGDYFGRVMAETFSTDAILLVPLADWDLEMDDIMPTTVGYAGLVNRAGNAQPRGGIDGILFHQGVLEVGDPAWPGKVQTFVTQLRADLGLGTTPILIGTMPDAGCCEAHNDLILGLTSTIAEVHIVDGTDLSVGPDGYFDLAAQRVLGARYAATMTTLR